MKRLFTPVALLLAAGAQTASAQDPCSVWNVDDIVKLTVDNPQSPPAALLAGACGTVIACDSMYPDSLLVLWNDWSWDNGGVPDSAWWVMPEQLILDPTCQGGGPVCGDDICEAGEDAAGCSQDCAATCPGGLTAGQMVMLGVDNPNQAQDLPTGTVGMVVCCEPSAPALFIDWQGWNQGTADATCSPVSLPNDSGWWVAAADLDWCPTDPDKIDPGICGCGVGDIDSDSDGTLDCNDACAADPNKVEAGACGCDNPETDSDSDGTADCLDGCPADPDKADPGVCGCGIADTDTDSDGVPDCNDQCPANPDGDSDRDGVLDCDDGCPLDGGKTAPGICGCSVADTDTDKDGKPDCQDACPTDAAKTVAGQCDCGVTDTDSDNDSVADCLDGCDNDAQKTLPGQCGCGISDVDSDADGIADCNDRCPGDPAKASAGQCGCGVVDTDSDGDGIANCKDECPNDAGNTCNQKFRLIVVPEGAAAAGLHPAGTCIEVSAPPAPEGTVFSHWSGDVSGSDDPINVCLDRDRAITANYSAVSKPASPFAGLCGLGAVSMMPIMLFGLAVLKINSVRLGR